MSDMTGLAGALNADPILRELDAAEELPSLTETGAAIGVPYPLGTGEVGAPPPGAMLALAMINSPLLGDIEQLTEFDAYRALYAIGGGREALRPLMGLHARLLAARRQEETAKTSPELYRVYLDHLDVIESRAWAEFDAGAAAYAEQFGEVTSGEVFEIVTCMLRDARASLSMLPSGDDDDDDAKKKTRTHGATRTGLRTWLRRAVARLGGITRRPVGACLSPV